MLHMDKEDIQRLKIQIENEIIIAERKHSPFAKRVDLSLLSKVVDFIAFKMAETEMLNNEIRERDEHKSVIRCYQTKNRKEREYERNNDTIEQMPVMR